MNKYYKLVIITLISGICLYFSFKGEDFNKLSSYIKNANYLYLFSSLLLLMLSVSIRASRFVILLLPICKISYKNAFISIMIGYFGNGVFPFRAGEFMRAYSISNKYNLNTSKIIGSVALDRLVDLFSIFIIILCTIPWFPTHNHNIKISIYAFTLLFLMLFLTLVLIKKLELISFLKAVKILQNKLILKLVAILEQVFEGIDLILKIKKKIAFLFFTIALWSSYYFMTYFLLKSVSINLNLFSVAIVLVLGAISLSIPALPGGAGTYEIGVKYALMSLFYIEGEKALAYALVSHASNLFPYLFIGGAYFILDNYKESIKMKSYEN